MKSSKTIIAVLMIFSLLFLGWTEKGKNALSKPGQLSGAETLQATA